MKGENGVSCFWRFRKSTSIRFPLLLVLSIRFSLPGFSQETAKPTPLPTPPAELGKSCVTAECHVKFGDKKFSHGFSKEQGCESCHTPLENRHKFEKIADKRALCLKCHPHDKPKANQHPPFEQDCTVCHEVHASTPHLLKSGGGPDGCTNCHDRIVTRPEKAHAPLKEGKCLGCHTAHESDHEGLLKTNPDELCLTCHDRFAEAKTAVSSHVSGHGNTCSTCHRAHESANPALLRQEESKVCTGCHAELLDRTQKLAHPHGAMTQGKTCRNCHTPHFSNQKNLLDKPAQELCLACHNQPLKAGERTLANIADELKEPKSLHKPLKEGDCSACHQAHGNANPDLLDNPLPPELYAEYKTDLYANCYKCHDKAVIETAQGTQTHFRNGEQNLHYLHVIQGGKKGHTCRLCHQPHTAEQPRLIRKKIAFGKWEMPLAITVTETGGSCATGCHPAFGYDRKAPVTNSGRGALKDSPDSKSTTQTVPTAETPKIVMNPLPK